MVRTGEGGQKFMVVLTPLVRAIVNGGSEPTKGGKGTINAGSRNPVHSIYGRMNPHHAPGREASNTKTHTTYLMCKRCRSDPRPG